MTAADGVTWNEFTVPGALLVTGDNVIASEVHQDSNIDTSTASSTSSSSARRPPRPTRRRGPTLQLGDVTGSTVALSWSPSTDDSGILGYAIRRNGALVGFGPATTFTDTGLSPTTQYTYQVTAIDTSGNSSTPGRRRRLDDAQLEPGQLRRRLELPLRRREPGHRVDRAELRRLELGLRPGRARHR